MRELNKLTVKGLYKAFGDFKVLNDFHLTVEKGEFVTFLGPSGCGKSTALNCVCGLLPITSGEIYIDDTCIDNGKDICVPAEKRGFGMVFQNYALFPHMSVYQNIAFGLELKKMSKDEVAARVTNAINVVHLQGFEKKFPGQLSGGQQQRVAIARCIVLEPLLLMLDEPLSNLDAKLRMEMRYELKSLHERLHIATIYVTHDQSEALALSDKIVVMKRGLVMQIGAPKEIYSSPMNLFVADFMGFKNFWKGRITQFTENGSQTELRIDIGGAELVSRREFSQAQSKIKEALKNAFESGGEVETAIRPENFILGEREENTIRAKVELVSYSGVVNDIFAVSESGVRLDAKIESERILKNEYIPFHIPGESIHVFVREGTDNDE